MLIELAHCFPIRFGPIKCNNLNGAMKVVLVIENKLTKKWKNDCTTDLLFPIFGFSILVKLKLSSWGLQLVVCMNPNQWNKSSAVQIFQWSIDKSFRLSCHQFGSRRLLLPQFFVNLLRRWKWMEKSGQTF